MSARRYLGTPGHLIVADRCRFHIHTHIGRYCISTVGEFYEKPDSMHMTAIGHGRHYETMAFRVGENGEPNYDHELIVRGYNSREAANDGHEEICKQAEAGALGPVGVGP